MSNTSNIQEATGAALTTSESASATSVVTLADYLYGCVNIDVPSEVIVRICLDRDVDMSAEATEVTKAERDLCKADLLVWMVMGVSRRGAVSDTDNGWTHSDGGYTLSDADKKLFLSIANKIYEENGEDTVGKTSVKIQSHGIKRANFDLNGMPLPYVVR